MRRKRFAKKAFRVWLDYLARNLTKIRDDYTCQKCGLKSANAKNIQWCHIKSRKSNNLRWLPENNITLCGHCHSWGHDNPDEFIHWFEGKYPAWAELIGVVHRTATKVWREPDYRDVEYRLLIQLKHYSINTARLPDSSGKRKRLLKVLKGE